MSEAQFTIEAAWRSAVLVTAETYRVKAAILGSRGRPGRGGGACTPRSYWEARKVAVYVAVMAADCSYAALARVLGMHKDTVTSQCEQMRTRVIGDPMLDRRLAVMEHRARAGMALELADVIMDADSALAHARDLMATTLLTRIRQSKTQGRTNPTGVAEESSSVRVHDFGIGGGGG